jgi:hypothetical protein
MSRVLCSSTPPIGTNPEKPRRWKAVGGDRIDRCTFCGGSPTEAVVGCPDDSGALVLWEVAICEACLADTIMTRFAAVKYQRIVQLGHEMSAAADEIVKLGNWAGRERRKSGELRAEELAIREKDTPLHDVTRRGSPLL